LNSKQFNEVVEYFEKYSMIDDEDERREDAEAAAMAIDDILKENADE